MTDGDHIFTCSLIGGFIGVSVGTVQILFNDYKQRANSLNNVKWLHLKYDKNMTDALIQFKIYEILNPTLFDELVTACDRMISLWVLMKQPNVRKEKIWIFKQHQYKEQVESLLNAISKNLLTYGKEKKLELSKKFKPKSNGYQKGMKAIDEITNMTQYVENAERIGSIISSYSHNIITEISANRDYSFATPLKKLPQKELNYTEGNEDDEQEEDQFILKLLTTPSSNNAATKNSLFKNNESFSESVKKQIK